MRVPRAADREWAQLARALGITLRDAGHDTGGLLVVGTPSDEPWHLVAHLHDAATLAGRPELAPTLIRHHVPPNTPPHLSVDLRRLEVSGRHETLLVVAADNAPAMLLERVNDARHAGATVLAIETGDRDLQDLAHQTLTVTPATADAFETAQHIVSATAGSAPRW